MKLSYFNDTDTLHIELSGSDVAQTKDLDENTLLDVDSSGRIVGITIEHASQRADVSKLVVSGIAA